MSQHLSWLIIAKAHFCEDGVSCAFADSLQIACSLCFHGNMNHYLKEWVHPFRKLTHNVLRLRQNSRPQDREDTRHAFIMPVKSRTGVVFSQALLVEDATQMHAGQVFQSPPHARFVALIYPSTYWIHVHVDQKDRSYLLIATCFGYTGRCNWFCDLVSKMCLSEGSFREILAVSSDTNKKDLAKSFNKISQELRDAVSAAHVSSYMGRFAVSWDWASKSVWLQNSLSWLSALQGTCKSNTSDTLIIRLAIVPSLQMGSMFAL